MPPSVPNGFDPLKNGQEGVASAEKTGGGDLHSEFNGEERRFLLRAAHAVIGSALGEKSVPDADPDPTASSFRLSEKRGVFTTIYWKGNLRGCVGHILPSAPLLQTVMETAQAAAFHDPRFLPLTREELPNITISLSILSALEPIQPEQIEIGRHGLLISLGTNRGLLLPQVPVEHGWDRLTFLEQTCRKAGLPGDAWRKGATLHAFTAEVFGDEDVE